MGKTTKIEWCDSTLNLQMGCDGCELWTPRVRTCYAGVLTQRYEGAGHKGYPEAFDRPKIFPERFRPALRWGQPSEAERKEKPWIPAGMPRMVFLDDMGDTFTESLPVDWLAPYIEEMAATQYIWQILTKRPRRAAKFFNEVLGYVPANFWVGTSVTDQSTANARIPWLLAIPAPVRFLSCEPLLGPIDIWDAVKKAAEREDVQKASDKYWSGRYLHWVLLGGESGPKRREMELDWARLIRDQVLSSDVAFFVKQIDKIQPIPDDLLIREFPSTGATHENE